MKKYISMFMFAVLAAISFFGLQRAMPETATRLGEKLSVKELGRDYRLVLKNLRFVAGALATGFVSLPLLAWIAQSPVIIISGEQATSYEYGMLQVPIFGALIAGNLVLRRLTRCFMLPMRAVRGVSHRMNADFSYAFNIIIKVVVFRLIVARLHTFQWAIAKHRRTFFTAGPETMYQ